MATSHHIYGYTFEVKENSVEAIGNNVSVIFEDLNFTEQGVHKLIVYGRSLIDKNTIHVRFSNEDGESNQVVEFNQSNGYEERVFDLDKITGYKLLLLFSCQVLILILDGSALKRKR